MLFGACSPVIVHDEVDLRRGPSRRDIDGLTFPRVRDEFEVLPAVRIFSLGLLRLASATILITPPTEISE
jgi:hypothetical protein